MTDERTEALLGAWFKDREVTPYDVRLGTSQVMARLPEVRQRGRWWPLPTFDRPLATFPARELAPAPIPVTNGRTLPRGFTMFSALKFVVASVIVALFGGFLLSGVLTEQRNDLAPAAVTASPSPMTTDELLSGFVTEEVEPGVLRIVNDGYRDLAHPDQAFWRLDTVIVGATGEVWRMMPSRRLFRLGEDGEWMVHIDQGNTEAGPGGRLVTLAAGGLRMFDGESWRDDYPIGGSFDALAVQDDGTVWVLDDSGLRRTLPDGGWYDMIDWPDVYDGEVVTTELSVADNGEAWLMGRSDETPDHMIGAFLGFDGSAWHVVPAPDGIAASPPFGRSFDVAPDGTLWTIGDSPQPHHSLARFDDSGWTVFTEADGVGPWGGQNPGYWRVDFIRVAPDGSAWVNAADDQGGCAGLARFDGETWTPYLAGRCISDFDIAPDGSVWAVARESAGSPGVNTYVIIPEAVAATD